MEKTSISIPTGSIAVFIRWFFIFVILTVGDPDIIDGLAKLIFNAAERLVK